MISFQRLKNIFIFFCYLCLPLASLSQTYDFKHFNTDIGLPQNYVYCLTQDHQGYLWIGTGEGLGRYDGVSVRTFSTEDSLASDFIYSLFVDKNGIVWIGHDDGTLSYYKNGFHKIIPEAKATSPVKDISQDDFGNIWATVQNNGLIKIDKKNKVTTYFQREIFSDKLYYCIEPVDNFNFLVGTSEGVFLLKLNENLNVVSLNEVKGIPPTKINKIVKRKAIEGEYWIATEDEGFYLFRFDSNTANHFANNKLCARFNIEHETINDIYEENDGNLMLATEGDGVIKLFIDPSSQSFTESFNFSRENGLNSDFIRSIIGDRENNYWFATYGAGISVLLNEHFVYYNLEDIGFKLNKAKSVIANRSNLWIGLDNGILLSDPFCFTDHQFFDMASGITNGIISAFDYDEKGTLWIASLDEGLYYREKNDSEFKKYDYITGINNPLINDISVLGNNAYLATNNGFYIIDLPSNSIRKLTTRDGLPHNNINFIFIDKNQQVWIGPKGSGICKVDSANIEIHRLSKSPLDITGMTMDSDSSFWLSTKGKGVLKYNQDSLEHFDVQNGLAKNYCYDIVCDKNERLWVCHKPGISSIDIKTGHIRRFDVVDKMGGDFNDLWEDTERNIWFASSQGIIKYIPDKDRKNKVAPMLNFTNIEISGKSYPLNKSFKFPYSYSKQYAKFKFEFIGISFKNPQAVTYQYKMIKEGDNTKDWEDLATNFITFEFLPDGKYTLKVRAFNADGVVTKNPLSINFEIGAPIWKKAWFYLIVIAFIGLSFYWIIKFRERRLILQKEALQKEVDSQTIILREQKEEIEKKNHDITASINYAKRIQKSILPPVNNLTETFPESFIFFAPRDIVSGDFYWYTRKKEKFIICCADCTGHGVPGAFMSMIGTTLLNDINKLEELQSPADILEKLDTNIRVLLQKDKVEQSKDGMDISVIEINLNTLNVRLASAKRPVLLYINNELTIYNGTRRSIGDDELAIESKFINYEYDCSKGDLIYLFSDGYTDQFGGPKGKKMMKVGVKKLLEEIREKPMINQGDLVRDYFINWKGEQEQVDDVLFIGIQL